MSTIYLFFKIENVNGSTHFLVGHISNQCTHYEMEIEKYLMAAICDLLISTELNSPERSDYIGGKFIKKLLEM